MDISYTVPKFYWPVDEQITTQHLGCTYVNSALFNIMTILVSSTGTISRCLQKGDFRASRYDASSKYWPTSNNSGAFEMHIYYFGKKFLRFPTCWQHPCICFQCNSLPALGGSDKWSPKQIKISQRLLCISHQITRVRLGLKAVSAKIKTNLCWKAFCLL